MRLPSTTNAPYPAQLARNEITVNGGLVTVQRSGRHLGYGVNRQYVHLRVRQNAYKSFQLHYILPSYCSTQHYTTQA